MGARVGKVGMGLEWVHTLSASGSPAPTRALPELRSDQVRTRRCNCNGHSTGSWLYAPAGRRRLAVASRRPQDGRHKSCKTHARQRPHGRDGPSFSLPVSLREDANESRKAEHERHSVINAPQALAKRAGEEHTRPLSLSCLAKNLVGFSR